MASVRIYVIHGPNLNILGVREPDIYGQTSYDDLNRRIKERAKQLDIETRIYQSNCEGEIIDAIQEAMKWAEALVINPGAYTHYSYAITDALATIRLPVVEVHMTNIHAREEWRRKSVVSPVTTGQIIGFGPSSYLLALEAAKNLVEESHR